MSCRHERVVRRVGSASLCVINLKFTKSQSNGRNRLRLAASRRGLPLCIDLGRAAGFTRRLFKTSLPEDKVLCRASARQRSLIVRKALCADSKPISARVLHRPGRSRRHPSARPRHLVDPSRCRRHLTWSQHHVTWPVRHHKRQRRRARLGWRMLPIHRRCFRCGRRSSRHLWRRVRRPAAICLRIAAGASMSRRDYRISTTRARAARRVDG